METEKPEVTTKALARNGDLYLYREPDGQYVVVNRAGQAMLGPNARYSYEEAAIEVKWWKTITPAGAEEFGIPATAENVDGPLD